MPEERFTPRQLAVRTVFRFLFIYFMLTTTPWTWISEIPGMSFTYDYPYKLENWLVNISNKYLLHIADPLVEPYGSGDTSYAWAALYTILIISSIGSVIWIVIDRNRVKYDAILDYWLRTIVRYYIGIIALAYGIDKIFAIQMPFPSLSQLATPLGDFLPMRLSWMFIGYSTPYQVFSGIMEATVGILLLYRRTVTLGSLLGFGVFLHVAILNLSYDIPVKIFSLQMCFCCLFLMLADWTRFINFFILNKPALECERYHIHLARRWQRIARHVLKIGFVIMFVIIPIKNTWKYYEENLALNETKPIVPGLYDVIIFKRNNDTIPVSYADQLAWKDFVFDRASMGSVNTVDTLFRQRYRRGYFVYEPDSTQQIINFKKFSQDSLSIFSLRYKITNDTTMQLWGKVREDSLYFQLRKSDRHFQLAERQFHWLTEQVR